MPRSDLPPWVLRERQQVGRRIREFRIARGLSQERLANAAGISRDSVSRTELGTYAASLDILIRIARALDVPLVHFFWEG